MDDRSFDRLARLLGEARDRRTGLKALVGGLLGAGGLAALDGIDDADAAKRRRDGRRDGNGTSGARRGDGPDADRRKKKKTCKPACGAGYDCVKTGRKRACVCASGIECGAACCAAGQTCENGACAGDPGPGPEPGQCIAAGEPCKNVGRQCCDGRVCASGQGGDRDIACYAPKTGACQRTADCVYGMSCQGGRCAPPAPGSLGQPCDAAAQQLCTTVGAVCTAYTGADAPDGTFCTLPLRQVCSGDPDCTCYKCWYTAATINGQGRDGRASTNTKACCLPQGERCQAEQDCCLGLSCVGGFCGIGGGGGGVICTPDDAEGCPGAPCCNPQAICIDKVCKLAIPTGGKCTTGAGALPCAAAPDATCQAYASGTPSGTHCLFSNSGGPCAANDDCASKLCKTTAAPKTCVACLQDSDCTSGKYCRSSDNTCQNKAATGASCTGNVPCVDAPTATCTQYATGSGGNSGDYCLLADNETCTTGNNKCVSNYCVATGADAGKCKTAVNTGVTCTPNADACRAATAVCTGYSPTGASIPTGTKCLLPNATTCTANGDCQSYDCSGSPKQCQPCFTPFETKVSYTAKFPVQATASLASVSGVAIYPDAAFAYVSSFASQRMAKVDLSSPYTATVGDKCVGGTPTTDGCDLTGVGVTSDGKVIVGAWGNGTGASMIYEVDTTTLKTDKAWYRMPAVTIGAGGNQNTVYRRPNSIFYEGSSTSGTAWVGLWRGYSGNDVATSKSDLLKFTIASQTDWDNASKIPAATYEKVCGSFSNNAPADIRQIAPSGRTGDDDHLYIGCDNSKVIVFSKTSGTVVSTIPVPGDPRGVTFIGDTMYVSSLSSNVIYPFVLSGTGAALTYQPRCALKYVSTTPYPSEMARNTTAATGKVWLGATTGGVMTVTDFEVCTNNACGGVCCTAGQTCTGSNGTGTCTGGE